MERWRQQDCKLQNRSSPADGVLVHVLPHCLRRTRLHSGCARDGNLKPGHQSDNKGEQNNAGKRPVQSRSSALNLCCFGCPHQIHRRPVLVYNTRFSKQRRIWRDLTNVLNRPSVASFLTNVGQHDVRACCQRAKYGKEPHRVRPTILGSKMAGSVVRSNPRPQLSSCLNVTTLV